MACHLFRIKSLSEPMLPFCQLDPKEYISLKFYLEFKSFNSRKCTWTCRLPKWPPSCVASICKCVASLVWVSLCYSQFQDTHNRYPIYHMWCLRTQSLHSAFCISHCCVVYYRKTFSINRTKFQSLNFLVFSCSCLHSIHWSQVLSWEWRCSWSKADRRCSNYIWVIDDFIASKVRLI